jgi:hypothetical protein
VREAGVDGSFQHVDEEHVELQPNLEANEIDHFVSAVNAALGGVPGIGPLMAGLVTSVIPRQRLNRVVDVVRRLNDRVSGLERDFVRERMLRDEFMDLLEDAFPQAGRAATEKRKEHIAAILKNSIASDELAHEQEKELLSLLGQLNDSELITLGWYGTGYVGERADEYFRRHEEVLYSPQLETNASDEVRRAAALKEASREKLRRWGLARPGSGGLDRITELGRMLLREIDFYELEGAE